MEIFSVEIYGHTTCHATQFCIKCGESVERMVDGTARECTNAPNIIAISHIIAHRKFSRLFTRPTRS